LFLLQADFMSDGVIGITRNLGPFALTVLAVLAFFSIVSWAVIADRILLYRKAEKQTTKFLEVFRASSKFSQVRVAAKEMETTPLAGVFEAGYGEISLQLEGAAQSGRPPGSSRIDMEALERSLTRAAHEQRRRLVRGMLFLATTSSAAPFIGLFGTVWGIMNAFQSIGRFGNANLAVVAPGISAALITTAAGLAAAIPALIAYNHLLSRVRDLSGDVEDFGLEFLNVVQKSWQAEPGQ